MAVSPSGNRLATISISGQLTLWNLPSLKVQKTCLPNELVWILSGGTHPLSIFRRCALLRNLSQSAADILAD